jgi:hypothetical protein
VAVWRCDETLWGVAAGLVRRALERCWASTWRLAANWRWRKRGLGSLLLLLPAWLPEAVGPSA